MYKATFWADFLDATVEGWTDGYLWNGWATPYFEFAEAQRIASLFNERLGGGAATYDAQGDEFCFAANGETDCFCGVLTQVDGQSLRLYGIGTGEWIWEEAESPALA